MFLVIFVLASKQILLFHFHSLPQAFLFSCTFFLRNVGGIAYHRKAISHKCEKNEAAGMLMKKGDSPLYLLNYAVCFDFSTSPLASLLIFIEEEAQEKQC